VGTAYIDKNGNGSCEDSFFIDADGNFKLQGGEVVPYLWTKGKGGRMLSMAGMDLSQEPWLRAQAISGNGRVVLGNSNFQKLYAWIDEGKPIDLLKLVGAYDGYAMNYDASRVALATVNSTESLLLWDATKGTSPRAFTRPKPLQWCTDIPLVTWMDGDVCALNGAAAVQATYGAVPVSASDMSDDGSVIIGRAGDFFVGLTGVMYLERLGWIKLSDFFHRQGVAEAYRFGMDNPLSISGDGREMVGGIPGYSFTWYVDMKTAFVCKHGHSQATAFPDEFIDAVKDGAQMGRCELLK